MKSRILLIGGKSKTKILAASLVRQGHEVVIINKDYKDCLELAEIKGVKVICGDGTKPCILDEADAPGCDFCIALGMKDEDNLVACELCKNKFHVGKTVSLLSDPQKEEFFTKMGVDSVVCATETITTIIEQQALINDMTNVIPIAKGQAQIIEVKIGEDAPIIDKKLWEIELPKEAIVGCVIRQEDTIIPRGDTRIYRGDILVVILKSSEEEAVIKELTGRTVSK